MNIIWLGHGSFRIEIEDQVLLIDPWLKDNPMLPEEHHAEAIKGATQILVTHGHFDHIASVVDIYKLNPCPVAGPYELVHLLAAGALVLLAPALAPLHVRH
ncbi:MAG TPA: MBL fold metallo-hydrolase, partial [Sulfitobacter sp.]|nr:MBL fold metallo-hydrolase [Sulfitobacter sp.]